MKRAAAIALALCLSVPAAWAETYACRIELPAGTEKATLESAAGTWSLDLGDDVMSFRKVSGGRTLNLFSPDFDPDAGAVALLSVFEDGTAFLTVHGQFPGPDAATYPAHCQRKKG